MQLHSFSPMPQDGSVTMAEDTTYTLEDLERKNEVLENYFSNTIIPQLFVDRQMLLRKFTPPAMTQFSLRASDIGRHVKDLHDNFRYPTLLENINEVVSTGEIFEKEVQTTDRRWFQMNILPYVERRNARTNGVIVTFVDITERVRVMRQLEKANSDRETMLFALNHDIRQPLSTIRMIADLLHEDVRDTVEKEDMDRSSASLERAVITINELLTALDAHLRGAQEAALKNVPVEMNAVLAEVQLSMKEDLMDGNCEIEKKLLGDPVIFPQAKLRSIIFNLLSNALKFHKPEGPLHLVVSSRNEKEHVVLSVQDNGIGIDPADHERIFDQNIRIKHNIAGTGMGLYIIRRMVESEGGRIEVESAQGEGTTFSVYFKR